MQQAHALFVQGDYEAARKFYLEVLPAYPNSFDLLKNLAYCYLQLGPRGFAPAAQYYSRAYTINPNSREVAENLAKCYMGLKRYSEAAVIYRKLAGLPDAPSDAWKKVAEAYDLARRVPEAEAAYDAHLQRNPGDLDARASLGRLYSWQKAYDKALAQFRIVLSTNPNFPPALVGMARVLSWQGKYEESMKLYDRVLRLEPKNGEALTGKAFVLLWMGRPEEAEALFVQLRKRYPSNGEIAKGLETATAAVTEKLGRAARQRAYTAQAEADFRARLARNPKDSAALKALAEITASPQRCAEGIEFGRRAIEIAPSDPSIEFTLARSLAFCQQYSEAIPRYRRFLQAQPKGEDALYYLGDTLIRARRPDEAIEVFRNLLRVNPKNSDGLLGLARALTLTGNYPEALLRYDEVLQITRDSYDALQGKAYVLYWTGQYAQARMIFRSLAERQPNDSQNAAALEDVARAEEEARWAALRPPPDAPTPALLQYYEKRLASFPKDRTAMKAVAYLQFQLKNLPEAVRGYQQVVSEYPGDLDAKKQLALLLSWDKQYDASLKLYQEVLRTSTNDVDALENLARVYAWSDHPREALETYQRLLAKNPKSTGYQLEVARLQTRMKDYPAAREALATLLSTDPQNREARLQLAQLELTQRRWPDSQKQFDWVLRQNPHDPEALLGKAQVSYYQGNLPQAHAAASTLVRDRPDNFSAVFLLANIEHGRGHRKATLALLAQAEKLSPGNPDVLELRRRVAAEPRITLRTSASYAREIGAPGEFHLVDAVPPELRATFESVLGSLDRFEPLTGLANQDLRLFSYGTTIEFSALPRTNSYLSFTATPSDSPPGPERDSQGNQLPTGLTGAVGPSQFLYRQSTRFSSKFTLRGGAGLARFGPGALRLLGLQRTGALRVVNEIFGSEVLDQTIQDQIAPARTAEFRPVALAGLTIAPTKKFSLDVDASRSPVAYTPVAARAGVIEERLGGGLNFFFTPRTELHFDYFYRHYSSIEVQHYDVANMVIARLPGPCPSGTPLSQCFLVTGQLVTENRADHDQSHGGSVVFNQNLYKSNGFSFDAGYSGLVYGFEGRRRRVFLGLFNPSFYQRHLLTGRFYGKLAGPLGYDFSGGFGLQQTGQGKALTRGLNLSPSFTLKVSSRVSMTLGYTYYNTAQALGALRGNAVRVSTEWSF